MEKWDGSPSPAGLEGNQITGSKSDSEDEGEFYFSDTG